MAKNVISFAASLLKPYETSIVLILWLEPSMRGVEKVMRMNPDVI